MHHLPVLIFTNDSMDIYKPIPVGSFPPLRSFGGHKNQGITGNIQVKRNPDISVAVVKAVGIPVEEALADIGMNTKKAVIHL